MTTVLYICETCRFSDEERIRDGKSAGELLAEAVEALADEFPQIELRRHACLMACSRHCSAAISAGGKMNYVLGGFSPDGVEARDLLDYASKHAQSPSGVVPYREWPQGVKGHFVARIPPISSNLQEEE